VRVVRGVRVEGGEGRGAAGEGCGLLGMPAHQHMRST